MAESSFSQSARIQNVVENTNENQTSNHLSWVNIDAEPQFATNDVISKYCKHYTLVQNKIMNPTEIRKIINATLWHNINVFRKRNPIQSTALVVNTVQLTARVSDFFDKNMNSINLIPIVVFDEDNKSHIEYVWIVEIFDGVNIGISFKYIAQINDIQVMSIYLDKQQIQNQLVLQQYTFHGLNDFVCDINTLIINENISSYHESDECNDFYEAESTHSESEQWEQWEQPQDEKLDDTEHRNNCFY